jgi:hypothetical protein
MITIFLDVMPYMLDRYEYRTPRYYVPDDPNINTRLHSESQFRCKTGRFNFWRNA